MENVKDSVEKYFEHFKKALELYEKEESIGDFTSVGMGGSGIAGRFLENKFGTKCINTFYNERLAKAITKLLLVSYSGNTKETLSWTVFDDFIALTSGGELEEIAKEKNLRVIKLPRNLAPRASFPYMLTALSKLNSDLAYIDLREKFEKAWSNKERLDELVGEVVNRIKEPVIVYGEEKTAPQAYRLKTQLNENSKAICFFSTIPEAFHNEIETINKLKGTIIVVAETKFSIKASKILKEFGNTIIYESRGNEVEDVYFMDKLSIEYALKKGMSDKEINEVNNIKRFKEELIK